MLGKLPAIKSVYEEGIDFRRIDGVDAIALHDPTSSRDEIVMAFKHALDPTRRETCPTYRTVTVNGRKIRNLYRVFRFCPTKRLMVSIV